MSFLSVRSQRFFLRNGLPMNPIFSINYPELAVAHYLQKHFPKKSGYSLLIPLSGQQKGYDLALMLRNGSGSKVVTFQVKSSRTYEGRGESKANGLRKFRHYMWLNNFASPPEADMFVLIGFYAPQVTSLRKKSGVWKPHMLLFTQEEMSTLLRSIRKRRTDQRDTHFGFGFNEADEAFLTRGHAQEQHPDYSERLISRRHNDIEAAFV